MAEQPWIAPEDQTITVALMFQDVCYMPWPAQLVRFPGFKTWHFAVHRCMNHDCHFVVSNLETGTAITRCCATLELAVANAHQKLRYHGPKLVKQTIERIMANGMKAPTLDDLKRWEEDPDGEFDPFPPYDPRWTELYYGRSTKQSY